MKPWLRRIAIVWFALGAIVFLHGAITGDGLAGALLYRELIANHTASPMVVSELLFLPLVLAPLVILITGLPRTPAAPRHIVAEPAGIGRGLLLGGLAGGAIALLLRPGGDPRLRTASLVTGAVAIIALLAAGWILIAQSAQGYTADVDLDTGQAIPPARIVRVAGIAQAHLAFAYREESEVRGTTYGTWHNLTPLTATTWRGGQPIRVLADFARLPEQNGRAIHIQGWLGSAPPGYVRRVLHDRGLNLADDLVTLRDTPPGAKELGFALAIGLIGLAMSLAFAYAAQRAGSGAKPR